MKADIKKATPEDVKTVKMNYWVLFIVLLIIIVTGESWYIWDLHNKTISSSRKITSDFNLGNLIAIKGVVRTAGLNEAEKQKVGLTGVNYQITNIEDNTKLDTHGYFLKGDKLETLIGKCVQIIGTIPNEWSEENIKLNIDFRHFVFEYNREALIPNKIEELNYSSCHPYHDFDEVGKTQLQGTIIRNQRVNPFIDDDYEFKFTKPTLGVVGFEDTPPNFKLIIEPSKNSLWPKLEEQIGKETVIVGNINKSGISKGGYLRYFVVTDIRPLVLNRTVPFLLLPEQVYKTYTYNGIDYAIFQKGNMNVIKSGNNSGILYANKNDTDWKIFTYIKESSGSSNNPYLMDFQNGKLYILLVDTYGAGSGEGIGKLLSLANGSNTWNLESCFYYGWSQERFYEIVSSTKNLPEAIKKYIESLPLDNRTLSTESKNHCSDFQLVQN